MFIRDRDESEEYEKEEDETKEEEKVEEVDDEEEDESEEAGRRRGEGEQSKEDLKDDSEEYEEEEDGDDKTDQIYENEEDQQPLFKFGEFINKNRKTALGDNPNDFDESLIPATPERLESPRFKTSKVTEEERYMFLKQWIALDRHPKTQTDFVNKMREQSNSILEGSYGIDRMKRGSGRQVDSLVNHFFR